MVDLEIASSELRCRIQLQAQTSTPDPASGRPGTTWTTVRDTLAKIATPYSSDVYMAGQFSSEVTHIVSVRWTPVPLAAGMQIVFRDRSFHVESVDNVLERNVRINLMCLEINGVVNG